MNHLTAEGYDHSFQVVGMFQRRIFNLLGANRRCLGIFLPEHLTILTLRI